jgi:hypothetical protein
VAPLVWRSWQDEQASVPSCDRRRSTKRRSPSASFSGSAAGACGIGVIGSWSSVSAEVESRRLGGCANDPLAMNHKAKQSHTDRRRDRRTAAVACLEAKGGDFESAGISGRALPTAILPIVTIGARRNALDLGSMNSDVLQHMIVE